jgi:hypothetical protein
MGFTATTGFDVMEEEEGLHVKRQAYHTSYGEFKLGKFQPEVLSKHPIYYGSNDDNSPNHAERDSSTSSDNYDDILDIGSHQMQSRIADTGHSQSDYRNQRLPR